VREDLGIQDTSVLADRNLGFAYDGVDDDLDLATKRINFRRAESEPNILLGFDLAAAASSAARSGALSPRGGGYGGQGGAGGGNDASSIDAATGRRRPARLRAHKSAYVRGPGHRRNRTTGQLPAGAGVLSPARTLELSRMRSASKAQWEEQRQAAHAAEQADDE